MQKEEVYWNRLNDTETVSLPSLYIYSNSRKFFIALQVLLPHCGIALYIGFLFYIRSCWSLYPILHSVDKLTYVFSYGVFYLMAVYIL